MKASVICDETIQEYCDLQNQSSYTDMDYDAKVAELRESLKMSLLI